MSDEKIVKELKDLNKTLNSIRTFAIAETQLIKTLCLESQKQGRDIQKIKSIMEKNGGFDWWKKLRRCFLRKLD
ncbi:MAG: hypothetical protein ACTSPI_01225 [Candidatus Heimdallarchaeaceae archaeon]